jgi:hypothetical protein
MSYTVDTGIPVDPRKDMRKIIDELVYGMVEGRGSGITVFPRGDILVTWAILQLCDAVRETKK